MTRSDDPGRRLDAGDGALPAGGHGPHQGTSAVGRPPSGGPPRPSVRPTTCDEMVLLLPRMLGFRPVDSLVVAVLDGTRVEGVVRVDLSGFQPLAFRELLEPVLASCGAPRVLLVGYGERTRVDQALREAAMTFTPAAIVDQLGTDADHWWSLDGPSLPLRAPDAAWPSGLDMLLPDRATLVARAARPGEEEQRRLATVLDVVLARQGDLDLASAVGRTRELVTRGMAGARAEELLVELGLLVTTLRCRDEAWVMIGEGDAAQALDLWLAVARHAIDLVAPASLCMAATAAWRRGEWVLMGECLGHALQVDPGYSLANLLASALQRGVPVGVWQQAIADHGGLGGND